MDWLRIGKEVNELTLVQHLTELRWRLMVSVLSLSVGLAVGFMLSGKILESLLAVPGELVYLTPGEAFFTRIRISVLAGLALALPIILYQISAFVLPGLNRDEKVYLYIGMPAALVLFFLGALFSYKVMVPITYAFFLGFGSESLAALISVGSYVSFVVGLVIPFGLVFQLPLLVLVLTGIGLITPSFLRKNRKYALLFIFVLAAFLTPPDVISQVLMAIPLLLLYELSVWVSGVVYWRKYKTKNML